MKKKDKPYKRNKINSKDKSNTKNVNSKRVSILSIIIFAVVLLIYIINPDLAKSLFGIEENKGFVTDNFSITQFEQGFPELSADYTYVNFQHKYYGVAYSEKFKNPYWVSYILTKKMVKDKKVSRKDEIFTKEPLLKDNFSLSSDYTGSGYDRGHMCPAGDMNFNQTAMTECFYMSNITPQKPGLNRGVWKSLEEKTRDWAVENDSLYVVVGVIYSKKPRIIGKNKVAVPKKIYKIIADISSEDGYKAIAFVFENKDYSDNTDFMDYAITIDSLENMTNIDFFAKYQSIEVEQIESSINKKLWK